MSKESYHKDRIANRKLHPETLMMGYGYSPSHVGRRAEAAGLPDLDLRLRERPAGQGLLRPHCRPPSAQAGREDRGWSIRASTTRTSRSWRIGWRSGTGPSAAPCSPAAWRRSRPPAWPSCARATPSLHSRPLYGGTETLISNQLACLRRHALGLHRWCRCRADARNGQGCRRQGARRHDPGRDAGQPDQRSRRSRCRARRSPTSLRSRRGTARRSWSTTPCSVRNSRSRCSTAPIFLCSH